MKQLPGAIILSALIITGCAEDSTRADRVLVLDSWWSFDNPAVFTSFESHLQLHHQCA
jgi:hypothetical protein